MLRAYIVLDALLWKMKRADQRACSSPWRLTHQSPAVSNVAAASRAPASRTPASRLLDQAHRVPDSCQAGMAGMRAKQERELWTEPLGVEELVAQSQLSGGTGPGDVWSKW